MKINKQQFTSVLIALVLLMAVFTGCTGIKETEKNGISPDQTNPVVSYQQNAGTSPSLGYLPADSTSACSPVTITQTDGSEATLPCPPKRIIVTNSDAAEMLIALGAAESIVGITESTKSVTSIIDKIPSARSIGDWQTPNVEAILSLKPDAVISYASSKPKNLDQLKAANITIIYLDCYRLPKLAQDARAIGILSGHQNDAEQYALLVESIISLVTKRITALPDNQIPPVYFEGYSDFTAAGPGSGSDELLQMAGGKNIAAGLSTSSPKVSAEWVVSQNPEYVVKVVSSKETRTFPMLSKNLANRTGWSTIPAVQNDRVFIFSSGIQYGPKSYIGLATLAKILHPELFTDVDPQKMLNDYAKEYVTGINLTSVVYPRPS